MTRSATAERARFQLRTLLLVVAFASWGIACLFLPGALYLHFPIALIAVLTVFAAQSGLSWWRAGKRARRRTVYRFLAVAALLTVAASLYFPILGFAIDEARRANATSRAATQKLALQGIDPLPLRDAARKLHAQLKARSPKERRLAGGAAAIPSKIARLDPRQVIVAGGNVFVEICCTPDDWFGLLVFAEDVPQHGGDIKLAEGIWYWETP